MTQNIKMLPNSKDSEMMVLGCMLTSPSSLNIASGLLNEDDFYYSEHRIVFRILKNAHKKNLPIDVHLVAEELNRKDQLKDIGGIGYLTSLAQFSGTSAHVEQYSKILTDKATLRRLIESARVIESKAFGDPDDIEPLADEAEKAFKSITIRSRADIPLISIQNHIADFQTTLSLYRGAKYIGLCLDTLPIINEKLLGLRKLALLAAAPNSGKTALLVQMVIDALKTNPDACAVIVSLEMTSRDLIGRIYCHLSGLSYKTFIFGSQQQDRGNDPAAYFKESELASIMHAETIMRNFGDRLQIIDSEMCPNISAHRVINFIETLKNRTGCKRVIVAIDYLQVWPLNPTINRGSELEIDKWRIEQMKQIRDAINDDPIVVISEARKPSSSATGWGGDMSDVMGSARGTYTPDIVMLMQEASETDLAIDYERNHGFDPKKGASEKAKSIAKTLIDALSKNGISFRSLAIPKARDGMERFSTLMLFDYRRNMFRQFTWDDNDVKSIINQVDRTVINTGPKVNISHPSKSPSTWDILRSQGATK
jgi:replicative DNA helicase